MTPFITGIGGPSCSGFYEKPIKKKAESENCSPADRARLEDAHNKNQCETLKNKLKQIMFLPALSKGWCLNPKGVP